MGGPHDVTQGGGAAGVFRALVAGQLTNRDRVRAGTLAQVFDALSYYADHQPEIERYIEQNQIPDDVVHPLTRPNA
jgi:hypothetical protein